MTREQLTAVQYAFALLGGGLAYAALMLGRNVAVQYYCLFVPALICAGVGWATYTRARHLRGLAALRAQWGSEKTISAGMHENVRDLFDAAPKPDHAVDERTWADLNMNLVFGQVDRTLTFPGRQVLYRILRTPCVSDSRTLKERAQIICSFQQDQDLRECVQLALQRVGDRAGHNLAALLWGAAVIQEPRNRVLHNLMFAVAVISPAALLLGLQGVQIIALVFLANMWMHYSEQKQNRGHFESVKGAAALVRCGERLCREERDWGPLDGLVQELRTLLPKVKGVARAAGDIDVESGDPFFGVLLQYVSIFYLREVRSFARAIRCFSQQRADLQRLFEIIGTLDALQAVASYRESLTYYCEPEFRTDGGFELEEAYHPLLRDPVPNSMHPSKNGVLVTGSNMSGKSTFLRTVGLSVLMAETIYTVCASRYCAAQMRLMTSIGRADNVVEGKSYYLEEALAVLRVLRALDDRHPMLCIFDELYRGTNSEERITASYRVIRYIAQRRALVFAATHDLELTEMLAPFCENVHFSERVSDLGLEFDYKLKPGPATTRNAIALLRHLQYPEEITLPASADQAVEGDW